jgi:hypothetical protein
VAIRVAGCRHERQATTRRRTRARLGQRAKRRGRPAPTDCASLNIQTTKAQTSVTTAPNTSVLAMNNPAASSRAGSGASIPYDTGGRTQCACPRCRPRGRRRPATGAGSADRRLIRRARCPACQVTSLWTVAGTSRGLSTARGACAKLSTLARQAPGRSHTGSCARQVRAASRQTRFVHRPGGALLRPPSLYKTFNT